MITHSVCWAPRPGGALLNTTSGRSGCKTGKTKTTTNVRDPCGYVARRPDGNKKATGHRLRLWLLRQMRTISTLAGNRRSTTGISRKTGESTRHSVQFNHFGLHLLCHDMRVEIAGRKIAGLEPNVNRRELDSRQTIDTAAILR